jgi:hypothetical protein
MNALEQTQGFAGIALSQREVSSAFNDEPVSRRAIEQGVAFDVAPE